ncbi:MULTISPECIES: RNA polymerase sigma factor [unclassified Microbacterium]|uniref:RNA polymerase sigma factor n=1 Tax=Microbacterium TaxID=33882 RepID=UPI003BA1FD94
MEMRRLRRHKEFEAIIRDNEEDLLRYFQRRILNGEDAAEAFGELLLQAWKLRRRMPVEPVPARMWLFATARNVMLNSRRSLARRSAAVARLADEMRANAVAERQDEGSVAVRAALESLPEEDAELVRLVYWDGLRSHEAAAVLGINPSTARSRLSKSRQRLRVELGPPESSAALSGAARDGHPFQR